MFTVIMIIAVSVTVFCVVYPFVVALLNETIPEPTEAERKEHEIEELLKNATDAKTLPYVDWDRYFN